MVLYTNLKVKMCRSIEGVKIIICSTITI
ncbi:hypothetical protein E2C01_017508 [Portunus trituberculatus]|uniref:Uncharacterized protein n=1 Tax=Portunus trituberculatus TaxID=210409 RepID=A0A5B7DU01_PORTR|nr:hypothetical protein [Portunus trituberculatus]